ncbi:AsmA family protein [Aquabacter spiritensis]|uniref:AsmA protein n=1 Tax=Aquabacter spiritensis TaxID=933073 RepID=A0A4R3LTE1_9HYPH|nr:AsmA family protein [Aquabacter spiritensis]TCT01587.1 AsmA protein [Aquabacter spiritensis]
MTFGASARKVVVLSTVMVGGLALAGLGLLSAATWLVPTSELRKVTVDAIGKSTGQPVRFTGDPYLRLVPAPSVVLDKVVFPVGKGLSLDAEGAVARLRLLPLFLGRLEIADVTLDRPTFVVSGRVPPLAPPLLKLMGGPNLPELRLVGGTVALRNTDGLTEELISGIDARLDRSAGGGGLAAKIAFVWRDRVTDGELELADAAAFLAGKPSAVRLHLTSGDSAWLRFRGSATSGEGAVAEGEVSGEAGSLRDLLDWVGAPVALDGGLQKFSFTGAISARHSGIELTSIAAELDGNRSEGALSLKLDGPRPALVGTFAAGALDLSRYGRMSVTDGPGGAWDEDRFNLAPLARVDLDLRLSAARIRSGDSIFERVATSAVLQSGRLVVALGTAKAWGGMVRASLDVAPVADGAVLRLKADGTGIALDRAFGDLLGMRRIEGSGDVEASLEGTGRSFDAIARSLSGSVALKASNGAIAGIDVAQVLRRIERRPLSGGGDFRGGRTQFDRLSAKITLARGVATIERARVEGKQVQLSLEGLVAVGRQDIDLQGHAFLANAPVAPGDRQRPPFDLPFIVQGPWGSPYVMLDPRSLIERSGAAQPLLEAVRNRGMGEAAVRSVIEQLAKPTALPPASAGAAGN